MELIFGYMGTKDIAVINGFVLEDGTRDKQRDITLVWVKTQYSAYWNISKSVMKLEPTIVASIANSKSGRRTSERKSDPMTS